MQMNDYNPARRCARALLSLFHKHPNRRLSDSQLQLRRQEVNQELSEMGDDAIRDALQSIYRLAEADARRKAREFSRAMAKRGPVS